MLLKIELYRYKNVITGCVLEQDESITAETIDEEIILTRCDNVFICSSDEPRIDVSTTGGEMEVVLNIRGYDPDGDDKAFVYAFEEESMAKDVVWKIAQCVHSVNNNKQHNSFEQIL